MSSLCFRLDVKLQFKVRVPVFDTEYCVNFHSCLWMGLHVKFRDSSLKSGRIQLAQNTTTTYVYTCIEIVYMHSTVYMCMCMYVR
jgi:hypothetical protein